MKSDDLNAHEERIFKEVAKLIHERNPGLDEEAIKRQTLNLTEHARAASVSLFDPEQSAQKPDELQQLYGFARGMADVLENISIQSGIELRLISGSEQLPDLNRLQQDAKVLSEALREGLKKRPPPKAHRPKDLTMNNFVEEATNIFEQATGINLNDLPEPRTQNSRNIKHTFYQFVVNCMPNPQKYNSTEQYNTLKKYIDRYLVARQK